MATLASATLDIARLITRVVEGTATGGSVTTMVDAAFPWRPDRTNAPGDDFYNTGTIWFLSGTLDGKSAVVTDWARSTAQGTATFATQSATASGANYAICDNTYPRYVLRQAVNEALSVIGGEDLENTATTTVANQMTYDLPAGVYNVIRLEIATATSSPYNYVEIPGDQWREINDDIAFEDFKQPTTTGHIIRLTYRVPLTVLSSDTSAVPDLYDANWVKWAGAAYCYRWRYQQVGQDKPELAQFLTEAIDKADKMAARYMPKLRRKHRTWEHGSFDISGAVANDDPGPGLVRV